MSNGRVLGDPAEGQFLLDDPRLVDDGPDLEDSHLGVGDDRGGTVQTDDASAPSSRTLNPHASQHRRQLKAAVGLGCYAGVDLETPIP